MLRHEEVWEGLLFEVENEVLKDVEFVTGEMNVLVVFEIITAVYFIRIVKNRERSKWKRELLGRDFGKNSVSFRCCLWTKEGSLSKNLNKPEAFFCQFWERWSP